MANITSQTKRIARTERERLENRRVASAVKTQFRTFTDALSSGNSDAADAAHRQLISRIDKAVSKGALHRNTGSRRKARAAKLRAQKS
jgi:small subunit ribosomal protein S20